MITRYSRKKMAQIWEPENKYRKWLQVEVFACEGQVKLGNISEKAFNEIKENARFDIARIDELEKTIKHDVISFLTSVSEHVGESARFIHLGMTSSDILDTGLAIQMKEASEIILEDLHRLTEALKKKALATKDCLVMGRSHGVHAEPTTFGLKFALWYDEMRRNIRRMEQAKETISYGKISGPVGTFSNIDPFIEQHVCEQCGLKPALVSNQIIQRDRHAEFLTTLALIASSIDKIATEVRLLQHTEIREVEESFTKGQKGSSAMPHKRNPIVSEKLSGLSRIVRSNALAAMENVALWHERDISHSSVERIIIPDSTILVDYMLCLAANLIENLVLYPDAMKENLEKTSGLYNSQRIMLELVKKGVSREDSYVLVQTEAMQVWEKGTDFKELIKGSEEIGKYLTTGEIDNIFSLASYTKQVDTIFDRVFN